MPTTPSQDQAAAQALLTLLKGVVAGQPASLAALSQWLAAYLTPTGTTGPSGATGTSGTTGPTAGATGPSGTPTGITAAPPPPAPTGSTVGDGSAAAPTGTPQFPNVFTGYAKRPSWKVAGVDYRVGVNAGVALKKPTAANHPPGQFSLSPHPQLIIQGNGITVDGWDFTGFEVIVGYSVNTYDVTFTNCIFDGNGEI